jgi:uncharacterized protein (TIGR02466 family)
LQRKFKQESGKSLRCHKMPELHSSEMPFATPLLRFRVPDHAALDAELLAEASVLQATHKIAPKVDASAMGMRLFGWMNVSPPGGFNAPHTHPGAHWSGVYHVSQPEVEQGTSGMIELFDPRSDLPNWRIFKAKAFRLKRKIRPEAGEIVMFPSYLVHRVYPNETDDNRVTVAFNATFEKAGGQGEDADDD